MVSKQAVGGRRSFLLWCLLFLLPFGSAPPRLDAQEVAAEDMVFRQRENVVYHEAHGVCLVMDIFTPKGTGNGHGIVDVISGAWHSDRGKIRDHLRAQTFPILCRKGYTVFAVRPGSITKFAAPEMLEHLQHGIRWTKSHADEFHIDPDHLGLMGASAGGHLACLAAVSPPREAAESEPFDTRVAAAAVFFPPTDFLNYGGRAIDIRGDGEMSRLLGRLAFAEAIDLRQASDEQLTQAITRISPARLVTAQAPPFLLIHGDADPVVPLQQSEAMVAALKGVGVPVELIVKKGGGHPWLTLPLEVKRMADWFDRQLLPDAPQQ